MSELLDDLVAEQNYLDAAVRNVAEERRRGTLELPVTGRWLADA